MELAYDSVRFFKFRKKGKEEVIEKIRRLLAGENRILLAVVFGSFLRRSNVRDIDLGVYSAPTLKLSGLLSLNAKIEFELGFPVDLVELMYLPAFFRLKVLREGVQVKGEKGLLYRLAEQAFSEFVSLESFCKSR